MKISELIRILREYMEQYGDLSVVVDLRTSGRFLLQPVDPDVKGYTDQVGRCNVVVVNS